MHNSIEQRNVLLNTRDFVSSRLNGTGSLYQSSITDYTMRQDQPRTEPRGRTGPRGQPGPLDNPGARNNHGPRNNPGPRGQPGPTISNLGPNSLSNMSSRINATREIPSSIQNDMMFDMARSSGSSHRAPRANGANLTSASSRSGSRTRRDESRGTRLGRFVITDSHLTQAFSILNDSISVSRLIIFHSLKLKRKKIGLYIIFTIA
jgi:hypothetical protein